MRPLVIYDSLFGNTEQIAQAIAQALGMADVRRADAVDLIEGSECSLLAIGGPTQAHGMSPALKALFAGIPPGALQSLPTAAFDTRLRMSPLLSGSAASGIARQLKRHGARLVVSPESFFVAGREGPLDQGEVERAEAWAATLRPFFRTEPAPAGAAR